jgi:copper homeostasis protein CutC
MELASLCLDLDYKLADGPRNLTRYQITFLMAAVQARNEVAEMQQLASQGITRIVFRGEEEDENEEEDRGK